MFDLPWDDCPTPDSPDRIGPQVHRLRPGEQQLYRLLGPWRYAWLHYGPRNSFACVGQANGCPGCPEPMLRWEGYSPALMFDQLAKDPVSGKRVGAWKPVILPIMRPLRDHLLQSGAILTGLVLQLKRLTGRKVVHEWEVMEAGKLKGANELQPAFDVRPILFRMWRIALNARKLTLLSDDQAALERRPEVPPGEAQPG